MTFFDEELKKIKEQGLLRRLRSVSTPQGAEIVINGRTVLNFCSNDYLGLAEDPRLSEAAVQAARRFGSGSGAARLISGNTTLYDDLERELADWKGTEAALIFNSGYHANIGVIPTLAREGDVIFSDALNHASIIDGCRLSKAQTAVYRHNDLNHLEDLLKSTPLPTLSPVMGERVAGGRVRVIVTEAAFSMEGDVCPLDDLLSLAKKYDALIYLDEAHAVGVFGDHGEGLAKRNPAENLICMGTMGKSFGSYGAFVSGTRSLRDYFVNTARSFIFSTALPAMVMAASREALKIIRSEPERRQRLWENIRFVGAWRAMPLQSPIMSLPIGPADKTMRISEKLLEEGIYLQAIRPPTVPDGTSRLRLTVSSSHTQEQLKRLTRTLGTFLP